MWAFCSINAFKPHQHQRTNLFCFISTSKTNCYRTSFCRLTQADLIAFEERHLMTCIESQICNHLEDAKVRLLFNCVCGITTFTFIAWWHSCVWRWNNLNFNSIERFTFCCNRAVVSSDKVGQFCFVSLMIFFSKLQKINIEDWKKRQILMRLVADENISSLSNNQSFACSIALPQNQFGADGVSTSLLRSEMFFGQAFSRLFKRPMCFSSTSLDGHVKLLCFLFCQRLQSVELSLSSALNFNNVFFIDCINSFGIVQTASGRN